MLGWRATCRWAHWEPRNEQHRYLLEDLKGAGALTGNDGFIVIAVDVSQACMQAPNDRDILPKVNSCPLTLLGGHLLGNDHGLANVRAFSPHVGAK